MAHLAVQILRVITVKLHVKFVQFQKVEEIRGSTHKVVTKSMIAAIDRTKEITAKFRNFFSESNQYVMYLIQTVYFPWFNILKTSDIKFDQSIIKSIISCSSHTQGAKERGIKKTIPAVEELKDNVNHVWYLLNNVQETAVIYNISVHSALPSFIDLNVCDKDTLISQTVDLIDIISHDNNSICKIHFKTQFYLMQATFKELWKNCIENIQFLFQYRENFLLNFYAEVSNLRHVIEVDKVTPRQQARTVHESFHQTLQTLNFLENNSTAADVFFFNLIEILEEAKANVTDFVNNIQQLKSNKLEMIKPDLFQEVDSLESSKAEYRRNFSHIFLKDSDVTDDENDNIDILVPSYVFELKNASAIVSYINDLQTLQEVLQVMDDILTSYNKMYLALSPPIDRALDPVKTPSK